MRFSKELATFALCIVGLGCGVGPDGASESLGLGKAESNAAVDCYEALTMGHSMDSAQHQVNVEKVEILTDETGWLRLDLTPKQAQASLATLGELLGCDAGDSALEVDGPVSCRSIVAEPGASGGMPGLHSLASRVCYVSASGGYFLITRDFVDSVNFVFHRWD